MIAVESESSQFEYSVSRNQALQKRHKNTKKKSSALLKCFVTFENYGILFNIISETFDSPEAWSFFLL